MSHAFCDARWFVWWHPCLNPLLVGRGAPEAGDTLVNIHPTRRLAASRPKSAWFCARQPIPPRLLAATRCGCVGSPVETVWAAGLRLVRAGTEELARRTEDTAHHSLVTSADSSTLRGVHPRANWTCRADCGCLVGSLLLFGGFLKQDGEAHGAV